MIIRPERLGDAAAIHDLTAAAFRGLPYSSGAEARIVDALRAAGALTVSLVAVVTGEIVGHVAFSRVTIDGEAGDWFGLGPVSVAPGRQRQGIGTALIEAGLARLRELGAGGCVVLGDPAYYGRFGFAADCALRYGDVDPRYFQALAFSGRLPTGYVRFHPGFEAAPAPASDQ